MNTKSLLEKLVAVTWLPCIYIYLYIVSTSSVKNHGPLFLMILCFSQTFKLVLLYFDPRPGPKILFQGDTPEGSDTFQRPVIERDRVDGLRLMIWEKVKVPFCHYSHAPEESNL